VTRIAIQTHRDRIEISRDAVRLLSLLAELEDAGLVQARDTALVGSGYDEGSLEVELPPTVTHRGREVLDCFRKGRVAPVGLKSGQGQETLFPCRR